MAGAAGRLDTDSIRALPHYGASFFRNRVPHLTATLPRRDGLWVDWIRALPHYGASFFRNRVPHLTATLPRRAKGYFVGRGGCSCGGIVGAELRTA